MEDTIHNPGQNMGIKCIQGSSEPIRGEPASRREASIMGSRSIAILLRRLPFEKVKDISIPKTNGMQTMNVKNYQTVTATLEC